ncbi:glycosyl hydrolase [Actinoplanes sp. NPDC051513]|uniref:glycosyl hydrolase n=1 Tax=Actinoplanes sp. NPDC051513 TaxID=3363908 RepID=UPI0037A28EDB
MTAALLVSVAACGDDSSPSASASTGTGSPAVAPYLDIVSGSADISDIYQKTGQASFAAAFVVADSAGTCTPTWGGSTAIDDSTIKASIDKITANGGKVIVATGGETGTYLETACSAPALASAYEKALDAAGSNYLDVDIEQTVTAATVTSALAALQKARGTAITLTLPVGGEEVGLTDEAIALLTSAKDAGVDVTVNAMTMNFTATGDWGTGLTAATEAVKDDVASVWPDLADAEVYDMLGVTPMIGVNNTGGTTTLANAKTLLSWAEEKGLGFVRFWSVNRDNGGCTDGSLSATCSGISQDDYAFTSLFKGYTT